VDDSEPCQLILGYVKSNNLSQNIWICLFIDKRSIGRQSNSSSANQLTSSVTVSVCQHLAWFCSALCPKCGL